MGDYTFDEFAPIRVVHYYDKPDDLGVVVRNAEGLIVFWHTGECEDMTTCGRLLGDYFDSRLRCIPLSPRLPTVTRSRPQCRRAWEWCWAASEAYIANEVAAEVSDA